MRGAKTILLISCALALTNASEGSRGGFLESSISSTVRIGATIASRLLNPEPHSFFPTFFHILNEKINSLSELSVRKGKDKEEERNDLTLMMLRLMGIDSRKMADFAFDGMISLLHLMNEILSEESKTEKRDENRRKQRGTAPEDFSLFGFILNQSQVVEYLEQMQDPNLVDLILKEAKKQLKSYPEKDVECINLLICRTKPFVRGMQRSLGFFLKREQRKSSEEASCKKEIHEETCREDDEHHAWERANLEGRMYFFLPGAREVMEWGAKCDRLFQNCVY